MQISSQLTSTVLFLFLVFAVPLVSADAREEIIDIVEASSLGEERHLLPEPVRARELIEVFYEKRDYQLAWNDGDQIQSILGILADSALHGLNPEDYHYSALKQLEVQWHRKFLGRDRLRARFDVLLSDGVLLYAHHQSEGKIDPALLESSWNFSRHSWNPGTVATNLSAAIDQRTLAATLKSFEPRLDFYQLLQATLLQLRQLDEQYEFEAIPDNVVLKPGMSHPNVLILREKLRQLGLWQGSSTTAQRYDDDMVAAVKRFQAMHSLTADGVVGNNSFRELNTTYADRIDQVRINMDRLRWINNDRADHMVLVNIAGYELYYFVGGQMSWETDVMVGTIRNETPIFQSKMKYLVLNPTWTVPRSIISKSLFRKMQANPAYVTEHNYKLYDSDGQEANPAEMNWSSYSPGNFPYRVVQQPGPGNALGRVKFIFPNKYAVYLHDTPSRALFERTDRAFSHGCIRVQDPLNFAELLLDDKAKWPRSKIDAVVESGESQVVHLQQPLAVMLMYWTASTSADGQIQFHPDVYKRDPKTVAALNAAPE